MDSHVFHYLSIIDGMFWSYVAFILIMVLGLCLTIQARFFQIRAFPDIVKTFASFLKQQSDPQGREKRGVHPLRVFFASTGGMIGIGNMVGIVTALQLGGPGALFWVWVAALMGTVIKYSEIYLGLTHRVKNDRGGYDGGPMFFLKSAFKSKWVPLFISILLCIYGVEIYQFVVVTDAISTNFEINRFAVMGVLMGLILYTSAGGVQRIGKICSWIMPAFMLTYLIMGSWVIFQEITSLPEIMHQVFVSAFSGHAAVGGFAGASAMMAIQHGVARSAYSADIGIGYDSIIQSESNTLYPERQAKMAILGVCVDNLICTMSMLIVLVSGVWKSAVPIDGSQLVQTALANYFPYMSIFMPIFLFIVGYTTMIAYFCVGIKCARFLYPKYGMQIYLVYGGSAFIFFSFFDQSQALLVMSLAQAMLLITNLLGIFKLRGKINFSTDSEVKPVLSPELSA